MLTLILVIMAAFLSIALLLCSLEATGGYLGDSSLVPGCLGVMALVIAVVIVIGIATGQIVFWIK